MSVPDILIYNDDCGIVYLFLLIHDVYRMSTIP
jgi:hypothetical protein